MVAQREKACIDEVMIHRSSETLARSSTCPPRRMTLDLTETLLSTLSIVNPLFPSFVISPEHGPNSPNVRFYKRNGFVCMLDEKNRQAKDCPQNIHGTPIHEAFLEYKLGE